MTKYFSKIFIVTVFLCLVPFNRSLAAPISDNWYIKDFVSNIQVNKDSSLLITEAIIADCPNCVDKHGIFRILPTQSKASDGQIFKTPIELQSITDFQNKPYQYQTNQDLTNHTITWKIGDPNATVSGINNYKIIYKVQNAIRFSNSSFDELYWNLLGNFWELNTESFIANLTFPSAITSQNTKIDYYTGQYGSKSKALAGYQWVSDHTLEFNSTDQIPPKVGITASVTFPKNIFTPYKFSFWELYGNYFYFLIPLIVLITCFILWSKYGRDPKINPTIVPEFDIPDKLAPMELGTIYTNGTLKNNFISAALINLAVKGTIKIEKIEKKGFLGSEDHKLIRLNENIEKLTETEKLLQDKVFGNEQSIEISSLNNKFYRDIPAISQAVTKPLKDNQLIQLRGRWMMYCFIGCGVIILPTISFFSFILSWQMGLSFLSASIILIIFGILMPQRTLKGAQFNKRIQGFRLYMETAEKYRQRFNEKENIFEKFLPYAIVFEITSVWINKMKEIYGEEYFQNYHPIWFVGGNMATFNAESFNSSISNLSSTMSSTLSSSPSSSSGAGGGGFSGGGGGGGGGGGW